MTDVFISYSRKDERVARTLNDFLAKEGWDVWWDAKIYGGAAWERLILDSIRDAKVVLVLLTAESPGRPWIKREIELGLAQKKLIPVRIERCDIPASLSALQVVDLIDWKDDSHAGLQRLAAGIAKHAPPSRIDTVRPGFDLNHLGTEIGLPSVTGVADEFRYLHFSVVMNPARRLAWYVAYNMQHTAKATPREADRWLPDPMLPVSFQPRNEHFGGGFDRGHLARRAGVAWGDERSASIAARQAFFWTNTSPQHAHMNRGWWLALEDWEGAVTREHGKAIGFSGPVLRADDPVHGHVDETIGRLVARQTFRLPQGYWKVVAVADARGRSKVASFLIEQKDVERWGPGNRTRALNCRIPLREIESQTGLEFPVSLHEADRLEYKAKNETSLR